MEWIRPRTITGPPAENDKYLRRQYINDEFWEKIRNGEHILFSAPRRVGKTSIIIDLSKNYPKGYVAIWENIEGTSTQKQFFKRLFTMLLEQVSTGKKISKRIGLWVKSRSIGEISLDGKIKFEKEEIDFKEELLSLIDELGNEDVHVVIMLDEFPEVLLSILKNEGATQARETLHVLRSIRQNKKFKNFTLVFAGSIGIAHVVASIDRPSVINDLHPIHVNQLTTSEANELISMLVEGATMQLGENVKDYLFGKISYILPYYIQLIIEKCDEILQRENRPISTISDIDHAFDLVISNQGNFTDWESRLTRYLKANDAKFCIGILTRCAHQENYSVQEAFDYSKKVKPTTRYKELLDDVLVKDGYLVEENGCYLFLSPLLKEWWKKNHPEFEIQN